MIKKIQIYNGLTYEVGVNGITNINEIFRDNRRIILIFKEFGLYSEIENLPVQVFYDYPLCTN